MTSRRGERGLRPMSERNGPCGVEETEQRFEEVGWYEYMVAIELLYMYIIETAGHRLLPHPSYFPEDSATFPVTPQ